MFRLNGPISFEEKRRASQDDGCAAVRVLREVVVSSCLPLSLLTGSSPDSLPELCRVLPKILNTALAWGRDGRAW